VVFFGLFHGLIFLPVLLSLVGPDPYPTTIRLSKISHGPKSNHETDNNTLIINLKAENTEFLPSSQQQTSFVNENPKENEKV
jgi:hypothetical protein